MYNVWARKQKQTGFTIVELLIVIVVIGVLAAIVIVAYNGIQNRARIATVTADLNNSYKKLLAYQIDNSAYPADLATVGIGSSGGTTFQYSYNNAASPQTYCITGTNGNISYKVTESTSTPASGGCPGHGVGGVAAITNLATNPSVESSVGWYSNNSSTVPRTYDTSMYRTGAQSVQSTNVSAGTSLLSIYAAGGSTANGFPITGDGNQYTATVYFRAEVANQARIGVAFLMSGVWTTATYGSYATGSTSSWTQASYTFTNPVGATALRTIVNVNALSSAPAGTKAWIDDYTTVQGSAAINYADGSSSGWVWNGSPNASTSTGPPL